MRSQPQSRPRLDPTNPFVKDLLIAVVPGCLFNLVDGTPITPYTGTAVSGRPFGAAVTAGSYDLVAPVSASSYTAKYDIFVMTALVVATQDSNENSNLGFYRGNGSGAATWGVGLHGGSNNGAYAQIGSYTYLPATQFDTKKTRVTVLTGDGSTARVYMDGMFVASGAYTQTAPQYSAATFRSVRFGANGGSNVGLKIRPGLGLLFKRALSDAEVKALSDNPWQVFAEDEDDEFIYAASLSGAGGATDTAVSPGAGSVAIIGYAPAVTQSANQNIAPSNGGITLTGYAPTISQPQSITTGTGSLAITGYAPTVTQGATTAVVPGAGSLTLTGYAPNLAQSANQALSPAVGALSISGYAPVVAQSANQAVSLAAGALSITGYAPTVTQASASQNIAPDAGQLTITGYEPTVTQSGGAGRRKKFQVETSRGIIEVDTLDEVAQIARVEKRTPKAPAIAVKLDGMKVSTPSLKPNVDYKAIEARMRAQVQAEMDEEEELLMMLL